MTDNCYCVPGSEYMEVDMWTLADRAWGDGEDPPILIEEWTMKPVRSSIKAAHTIDHVIEFQMEEYGDEYGDVFTRLEERAKDPAVVVAFDAALDLLFEGARWSWADQMVGLWRVTWDPETPEDEQPAFTYAKVEQ